MLSYIKEHKSKEMDLNECINELYQAHQRQWSLEKQIHEHLNKCVEEHRIHQKGDIVEVYEGQPGNGKYIGDAIVGEASTSVFISVLELKEYGKKPELLKQHSERIRYELFGINKKGEPTKYHLFGSEHYLVDEKDVRQFDWRRYIKAKIK